MKRTPGCKSVCDRETVSVGARLRSRALSDSGDSHDRQDYQQEGQESYSGQADDHYDGNQGLIHDGKDYVVGQRQLAIHFQSPRFMI